jgi:hypothetical protein
MSRLSSPWLRMLISAVLMLVLLTFLVDLGAAWQAIKQADWAWFGWLAVWITLDRLLMAYKWRLLLICRGIAISHLAEHKGLLSGQFRGLFSAQHHRGRRHAGGLGERPGRRGPASLVAASVVMERPWAFLASALAAGLALLLLVGLVGSLPPGLLWPSLAVLALVSLGVVISLFGPFSPFSGKPAGTPSSRGKLAEMGGAFFGLLHPIPPPLRRGDLVHPAVIHGAVRAGGGHLAHRQGLWHRA